MLCRVAVENPSKSPSLSEFYGLKNNLKDVALTPLSPLSPLKKIS